jgi:hypothetical protein
MSFALRDYQIDCKRNVLADFDAGKQSALIVMATGTGKTQDFLSVAEEYLKRFPRKQVLVIAHREELIFQPAKRWCKDFGGSYPAIEMGGLGIGGTLQMEMFGGSIDDEFCDDGIFVFRHLGYFIQVDRKRIKRNFSGRAETAGFASVGTLHHPEEAGV